jgi:nitrate reductase alpha subunit
MARTDLTVTEISLTGVNAATTLEAANADGEAILNNGETFIEVLNANAAACTVTVVANRVVDGLTLPNKTVSVTQNQRKLILLGPRDTFNQRGGTDDGKTYVNFSAVTDVTVAAWRLAST